MTGMWLSPNGPGTEARRVDVVPLVEIDGDLPIRFGHISGSGYDGIVADRFELRWERPGVGDSRNAAYWPADGRSDAETVERAMKTNPQQWLIICATRIDAEDHPNGA